MKQNQVSDLFVCLCNKRGQQMQCHLLDAGFVHIETIIRVFHNMFKMFFMSNQQHRHQGVMLIPYCSPVLLTHLGLEVSEDKTIVLGRQQHTGA